MRLHEGGKGVYVNLVCHRSATDGQLVLLPTNRPDLEAVRDEYHQRWAAETCHSHLTKRALDLERTHLRHGRRLALLVMQLALCLLCALQVGLEAAGERPIVRKKDGRNAIGLFRLGLDRLQDALYHLSGQTRQWSAYCRLFLDLPPPALG